MSALPASSSFLYLSLSNGSGARAGQRHLQELEKVPGKDLQVLFVEMGEVYSAIGPG